MTGTTAQQHFRLPVDASPPPERLRWPMLLAVGAAVLALHIALVTVFTPLAPEQEGPVRATEHSTLFVSSQTMSRDPDFLKMVGIYDPIAFLHPPEDVGFSFFRATRDDFSLDAPTGPVLLPRKFTELEPLPPLELEPVVRPLPLEVAETYADLDDEAVFAAPVPTYPYCVADSRPDVTFPSIPLDTRTTRILQRTPPSKPSVFELRLTTEVVSSTGPAGSPDPRCETILTESCGNAELDLAARAWLDTLVNSQEENETALRRGDRCRVIWSAKAFGKEPTP